MNDSAVFCVPTAAEASAVRRGLAGTALRQVVCTGVGTRGARLAAASPRVRDAPAVMVTGIAGALRPELCPGDVVVADEVRHDEGTARPMRCPSAPLLAARLRAAGFPVHVGPIVSTRRIATTTERRRLAAAGALAVDTESAWLLGDDGRPSAVVRVVADTAAQTLLPPAALPRIRTALRRLTELGPQLHTWASAVRPRTVLLAGPRSFCAGVERAIEVVERALAACGAPIYVRKQIVHNVHVVRDLERRGAVFVDELDDVPDGATLVFSAHGVSPAVREEADRRGLQVVDATCPLVTKVHNEARRFSDRGDTVVFIGHAGHEETEGTMGERPGSTVLVENAEDARRLEVPDPERVSYLVQTTLAADEVDGVVRALRDRFPRLQAPPSDDICYATTNRQHALRAVAAESDVVLVVGSENSSNSNRLVESAQRMGVPAHRVDDAGDVDLEWLCSASTVGMTAGASAPTRLVDSVAAAIGGLGPADIRERRVTTEDVHFTLPKEVRRG